MTDTVTDTAVSLSMLCPGYIPDKCDRIRKLKLSLNVKLLTVSMKVQVYCVITLY